MFEQFAQAHRSPRRSRSTLVIAASVIAHGAVVVGLLLSAAWQIDKLRPAEVPVALRSAAAGNPELAPGEPPPARRLARPRPRRITRDLAQASLQKPDEVADDAAATDLSGTGTGGGGGGGGIGVLPCTGDDCTGLDAIASPRPAPIRPPEPPAAVAARLLEGQRIAGDPRIAAPDSVRLAMMRGGETQVTGVVKMCLDREGQIESLKLLSSTGHDAYDARLLGEMRAWRYRPYRLDGDAVRVCTAITIIYRMR